jgi:hypothetical protein
MEDRWAASQSLARRPAGDYFLPFFFAAFFAGAFFFAAAMFISPLCCGRSCDRYAM